MGKLFKSFILLAGISLLLAGCAKEESLTSAELGGEQTTVTFTASMDGGTVTKAVADGDGDADFVNRCIMEIYYGDELFTRMYSVVDATAKTASFSTQLVANRTYTVAFWADHVDAADSTPTDNELTIDKFYVTAEGLKAVALNGTYAGNNDMRDAFFHCGSYEVEQGGSAFSDIRLYRPFSQVNVITTDLQNIEHVPALKPTGVDVTVKNAYTTFDVVNGTLGGQTNLGYTATLYNFPETIGSQTEATLSMDYLFAAGEKAVIDIVWKATKSGDNDVVHSFTNIPYQRNYRTNIKGALLTTQGQWNVTVVPTWNEPDEDVAFTVVNDIASANDFVAANTTKKEINVTFSSQPADAGNPTSQGKNAIVTSLLAENAVYNIDVASSNEVLYVGDYDYSTSGSTTTYNYNKILQTSENKTKAASVNLVVTNTQYIGTLVVNSPSKSVSINGQTLASGKAYHIENLTVEEVSMNTVIIESGMSVTNLTMKKGGLEIHGTVGNVVIPENTAVGTIVVRDCENLSEEVYSKLCSYIASGYVSLKGRTTADKWDIYPAPCKISETVYATLQAALDAVTGGETILMTSDITQETGVHFNKSCTATLDLNGHTFKVTNDTENNHRAIKITKGTLNIKDGTIDARNIDANGQPQAVVTFTEDGMYGSVRVEDGGAVNMSGVTAYNNHCYGASVKVCEGSAQTSVFDNCTFYSEYSSSFEIASSSTIKNSTIYQQGISESDSWKFNCSGIAASQGATATVKDVICNASNPIAVSTTAATDNNDRGTNTTNVDNGDVVRCYGTYESNEPTSDVNIQNGTFSGKLTKTNNTTKANISLTGGKYSVNPSDFVASGYSAIETGDATYPYEVKAATVARIGGTGYTSLASAIAAVPTDGTQTTITMIANTIVSPANANQTGYGVNVGANQNVVLDLAGYTISGTSSGTANYAMIQNNGTFEIKDSKTGGKITYKYNGSSPAYGYYTNTVTNTVTANGNDGDATLTVTNGIIENTTDVEQNIAYAIDNITNTGAQKAILNIKDGTFNSLSGDAVIRMFMNSQIGENKVIIDGGTFNGFVFYVQNPTTGDAGELGNLTINGGTYTCNSTGKWLDLGCSNATNFSNIKVNINDGYFTGKMKIRQNVPNNGIGTVVLSGGKFSTTAVSDGDTDRTQTLKDYVASGYSVKANTDEETKANYPYAVVVSNYWPDYAAASFSVTSGNTITIQNAAEMALLAKNVQAGTTYEGWTISLGADIDLSAHEWVPMGTSTKYFHGTFEGANKIISNVSITGTGEHVSFFGYNYGSTFQNVTFDNANVSGGDNASIVVGYGANIQNVTVKNSTLTGKERVGAIAGGGYTTCTSCTVDNCTISGTEQVGGIEGYICGTAGCSNTVKGCTISASKDRAGGLFGKFQCGDNGTNTYKWNSNRVEDCTISAPTSVGGIAGEIMGNTTPFEVKSNYIDANLDATDEKESPIGILRSDNTQAFNETLESSVTGNTWTTKTRSADTYVYTADVTKGAAQTITNAKNF